MRRGFLVLALLALLLASQASAHYPGARPILQRSQFERIVDLDPDGLVVSAALAIKSDPLRHTVSHSLDPARGTFALNYRTDASRPEGEFFSSWGLDRLVEFRDHNADGKFTPSLDQPVKAWRFTHFQWRVAAIQEVQVGGITSKSVVWEANLSGAPNIRLEAVIAGKDFTDEGATVRPQDVVLYLDFLSIPTRGIGSLYALEGRVSVHEGTLLNFHAVENRTVRTALLADAPLRRSLIVWGGEALLDGREQTIETTLEDEHIDESGQRVARIVWHLPTTDRSMKLIFVSAVEYATPSERGTPVGAWIAPLALVAWAFVARRRR